jgi:hypothetical protein
MSRAKGAKSQLLLCYETAYNTTPTTPTAIRLPIISSAVKSAQNLIESSVINGRRDPVMPARGNIDVGGSIEIPVDEIGIGYWLKLFFGAPTTTGTADPYTHVFKIGESQPSAVLEQGFSDISVFELFNGVKVSKFSISFGGDGELTAKIDVIGGKETIGATSVDATPTTITITKLGNFQAALKEGGTSIATVLSVDLNFDFGLDGDTYCLGGGGFRTSIEEGIVQISGTLKAFFENTTLLNKAINGTESSLEITLTNGTHSLAFKLPELIFERNSPGIDGPKGVNVELPYKAYFDNDAGNSAAIVTLVNGQTTYA